MSPADCLLAGGRAIRPVFQWPWSMPLHVACRFTVSCSLLFHDFRAKGASKNRVPNPPVIEGKLRLREGR